jgi:transposase|tara:strand:- start:887 stop:1192 length:306 start_codon:yes stop_codon:yes gene_type:complete
MPKQVNYSVEMTDKIISEYQSGISVDEIANAIGKSVRSVRSKLVREGVYIPQEKKTSKKVQEPTKKELLRTLDELVDFPTTGLLGATKESILDLIKFAESK